MEIDAKNADELYKLFLQLRDELDKHLIVTYKKSCQKYQIKY